MAAYAATTTLDLPHIERISRELGFVSGKCDITNYNQTGAEITGITGHFKTILRCIGDAISDNGYHIRWNTTDKCFHAFQSADASVDTEVANDVDVGEVNFIAIGLI